MRISLSSINLISGFLAFTTVAVSVGLPFEYSVAPILICTLAFAANFITRPTVPVEFVYIIFLIIPILGVALLNFDGLKEIFFLLFLSFGILMQRTCDDRGLRQMAIAVAVSYLVVALVEMMFPVVSVFKKSIFTRSFVGGGIRGVSSLAQEPSYFALAIFSAWLIYMVSTRFNRMPKMIFLLFSSSLIITKSSMVVLMMPAIIVGYLGFSRGIIVAFALFFVGLFLLIYLDFSVRMLLFIKIIATDPLLVLGDESFVARLFYIMKDIVLSTENFFLPYGPASYELTSGEVPFLVLDSLDIKSFRFDVAMSGSLLTRFLVEYGFLFILFLLFLGYKFMCKVGSVAESFTFFLIFILVFSQMISLVFSPIAIAIGVFVGWLLECGHTYECE